ncbi:patatin-like phospholipase family protein [Candidatus Nomurabacteria bacterium]|nr:patatin-like phospholipase family protein [Candidatus Nomurabacteria bacterium]
MPKRALILKGGTMRGAFTVGALKTVHRLLGVNHFDAIFATSVGVFEQAFFASEQIFFMENTWREYVHGNKLIKLTNFFKRKPILDLDYLVELFQSEKSMLDIQKMKNARPQLLTFVTDYETREPTLMDLKNGPVFDIMRATSAIPMIYPKKVVLNGRRYVDSWMADESKFHKFIKETLKDYDEVLAISTYEEDKGLSEVKHIIKPSVMPLWGVLDTNQYRLIKTIEQGEKDAEKFIIENNLLNNK